MENKFLKTVLWIVVAASFVGVFFVMSIMDLLNTGGVHEVKLDAAGQLLVIENSVGGIIPTGRDYYYVGVDGREGKLYAIHAGKKWLDENFDVNGIANGGGITVIGLSKHAGDFNVEDELAGRISQVAEESGYSLGLAPRNVLELNYVWDAIARLIAGVLIILAGGIMLIFKKKSEEIPAWARKTYLTFAAAALCFALWTIM